MRRPGNEAPEVSVDALYASSEEHPTVHDTKVTSTIDLMELMERRELILCSFLVD